MRLVDNQSVEKLAEDFDDDVRFINGVVDFLKDIRWIKQDGVSGLSNNREVEWKRENQDK